MGLVEVKSSRGWCGCMRKEKSGNMSQSWWAKHTVLVRASLMVLAWVWAATLFYYFYTRAWVDDENLADAGANKTAVIGISANKTAVIDISAKTRQSWTLAQCFYYSIQAGFSVGFGAKVEVDDWSRLYTIGHVLLGASMVSGALTVFSMGIIDRSEKIANEIQESLMENSDSHDGGLKTPANKLSRRQMVKKFRRSKRRNCCKCTQTMTLTSSLVVWLGLGAYFAHKEWGMTYIESAYFAITALSTAGLQSPGSIDDTSMWLTGVFVLFGVPLFGIVLGTSASYFVNPYMERKFMQKFLKASQLDVESFLEAVQEGGDDDVLTFGEYLEFCMVRAYDAKPGQVKQLRATFHAMDVHKDGKITIKELQQWVAEKKARTLQSS